MKEINDVAPSSLSHVACESNRGVIEQCRIAIDAAFEDNRRLVLTAVENGGAGTVSRRSKMAAHNRAGLWAGTIGATAPITPPFRERHRSAQRHGDLERDSA